jgi:hypothetical protein
MNIKDSHRKDKVRHNHVIVTQNVTKFFVEIAFIL